MADEPEMPDTLALRARAAHLMATGDLPSRAPQRSWGGPGGGEPCALCSVPIPREQLEFELEFPGDDGASSAAHICRFHTHCFDVWLQVRKDTPWR